MGKCETTITKKFSAQGYIFEKGDNAMLIGRGAGGGAVCHPGYQAGRACQLLQWAHGAPFWPTRSTQKKDQ